MVSTKEHANDWPRFDPMTTEQRILRGTRISAQRAESLRRDFDFPEDCDMVGLLAWAQGFLPVVRSTKSLTPAERRDTFELLRDHVGAALKLLAITEVRKALINPDGDPSVLFDVEKINRGLGMVGLYENILTCLEHFAAGQAVIYSGLTTRGRQRQTISVLRLVCAKTFLTIWQNHKGDPRGDRKSMSKFYNFMERAFDVIGHGLTGDEIRVVQRKLRQARDLPRKT